MRLRNQLAKSTKIDDKTVEKIQENMMKFDSHSTNLADFLRYVKEKVALNKKLFDHYNNGELDFKKLKFNTYTNTQRCMNSMIKNLKKKFGEKYKDVDGKKKPRELVFVLGDFDRGNHHMKGKEPIMIKKIRKIMKWQK